MSSGSRDSGGGLVRRPLRFTLTRMGRHKTITDDDVLRIARDHFRAHGHTATTRQIAESAGVSESDAVCLPGR